VASKDNRASKASRLHRRRWAAASRRSPPRPRRR
jgi:hypothetical protein